MYVILVYDINVERLTKVLKTCRIYLNWVQNSVFEGEITEADLTRLIHRLKNVIDEDEDSIIIYKLSTTRYMSKQIIGKEKQPTNYII